MRGGRVRGGEDGVESDITRASRSVSWVLTRCKAVFVIIQEPRPRQHLQRLSAATPSFIQIMQRALKREWWLVSAHLPLLPSITPRRHESLQLLPQRALASAPHTLKHVVNCRCLHLHQQKHHDASACHNARANTSNHASALHAPTHLRASQRQMLPRHAAVEIKRAIFKSCIVGPHSQPDYGVCTLLAAAQRRG